jgi:hypothetical protein
MDAAAGLSHWNEFTTAAAHVPGRGCLVLNALGRAGAVPAAAPTPPNQQGLGASASLPGGSSTNSNPSISDLSTPQEIRAAVLDLQNILVMMERRNHPGERGRWKRYDTARRKAILYRALPRVQSGNLKYGGHGRVPMSAVRSAIQRRDPAKTTG